MFTFIKDARKCALMTFLIALVVLGAAATASAQDSFRDTMRDARERNDPQLLPESSDYGPSFDKAATALTGVPNDAEYQKTMTEAEKFNDPQLLPDGDSSGPSFYHFDGVIVDDRDANAEYNKAMEEAVRTDDRALTD